MYRRNKYARVVFFEKVMFSSFGADRFDIAYRITSTIRPLVKYPLYGSSFLVTLVLSTVIFACGMGAVVYVLHIGSWGEIVRYRNTIRMNVSFLVSVIHERRVSCTCHAVPYRYLTLGSLPRTSVSLSAPPQLDGTRPIDLLLPRFSELTRKHLFRWPVMVHAGSTQNTFLNNVGAHLIHLMPCVFVS